MKQSVRKSVENDLTEQMSEDRPGDFNQAMMELGAVVCVPNGAAKCEECPLGHFCLARKHGNVEELPVKAPKKARTIEQRTVLVIQDGAGTAIRKRPDTGLLAGLYELPNVEGHLTEKTALARVKALGLEPLRIEALPDAKHIFSHISGVCAKRRWYCIFFIGFSLIHKQELPLRCFFQRGYSDTISIHPPFNMGKNVQYHLRFAHTPDI